MLDTKYPYVCHAEMNAIMNKNAASVAGAVRQRKGLWGGGGRWMGRSGRSGPAQHLLPLHPHALPPQPAETTRNPLFPLFPLSRPFT